MLQTVQALQHRALEEDIAWVAAWAEGHPPTGRRPNSFRRGLIVAAFTTDADGLAHLRDVFPELVEAVQRHRGDTVCATKSCRRSRLNDERGWVTEVAADVVREICPRCVANQVWRKTLAADPDDGLEG